MKFYIKQHEYYCGIDLHARCLYLCILNQAGEIVLHKNIKAKPDTLLKAIEPFRSGLVIGVECMFTWYWGCRSLRTRRHRFYSRSCAVHEGDSWR